MTKPFLLPSQPDVDPLSQWADTTDEQSEAQEVREEEALRKSEGGPQGCREERAPSGSWSPAQLARLPLPPLPPSPSVRLGSAGPCLVPMFPSSSSLTSSTWRKTGSWALPGIGAHPSSALDREDTVMVGGFGSRAWDRVWGRGSTGQARVAGPHRLARGPGAVGWVCSGLASLSLLGAKRTQEEPLAFLSHVGTEFWGKGSHNFLFL